MIKCLCKENVRDRITGEDYIQGKEYEFTEERAEEVTTANNGRYFKYVEEVTVEQVQAVATAIVEQAEEENKTIEEVVNEIVIEGVDEIPEGAEVVEEVVIDAPEEVVNEIVEEATKAKKSAKK